MPSKPSNFADWRSEVPIAIKLLIAVVVISGMAVLVHLVVQVLMALFFAFSTPRIVADEKKKKL